MTQDELDTVVERTQADLDETAAPHNMSQREAAEFYEAVAYHAKISAAALREEMI